MKTTKREEELENRVAELELINDRLLLDLEWEKLAGQKLMAAMASANKKNKKESRGTQPTRKMGKQRSAENKGKIPVDALGNREGSQGFALNAFIIPLIEKGKFEDINAATLSAMSGGQFTKGRVQDHLSWLRRKGLI